jgi:hypothetical protein
VLTEVGLTRIQTTQGSGSHPKTGRLAARAIEEIQRIDWGLEIVEGGSQKEINRPLRKFHFPNLSKEVEHSSQPQNCFWIYFGCATRIALTLNPTLPTSHLPPIASELESTVSGPSLLRCVGAANADLARFGTFHRLLRLP